MITHRIIKIPITGDCPVLSLYRTLRKIKDKMGFWVTSFRIGIIIFVFSFSTLATANLRSGVCGTVTTSDRKVVEYATVSLKGTTIGARTNEQGTFEIMAPAGEYVLSVYAIGYETVEQSITVTEGKIAYFDFMLRENGRYMKMVEIVSNGVTRLKKTAFNVVAIDAKEMHNSTLSLAGALAKAPGAKVRESGGVGSDTQFTLDGFSGRHIKFFVDGVPLEGVGSSFGINNIPVNFAERIEIYRGVVPVSFGADALGGVVNIVTGSRKRTFVDASYSFGSFNTHRSYINVGHTLNNGLFFEINAFQNYSDNNYSTYTPVKNLENGQIDNTKIEKVKRFNDTYHNETVIAKVGVANRAYADRMMVALNLSQHDKEIQTGVRQEIVFGEKRRKGYSMMPSFEYSKRNFLTRGLSVTSTVNFNHNVMHNLDTATYIFNWNGDSKYNNNKLGEQSYQDAKYNNNNWNATFNVHYHLDHRHSFILNHVLSAFERNTIGNSENQSASSVYDKISQKNISGLSYRFSLDELFNISLFGKYYNQNSRGPRNQATGGRYDYVLFTEKVGSTGYGMAATYFFGQDFQAKASYEKSYRLPTTDELFGDEDLELGALGLKPENSDNFNLSLSYSKQLDKHTLYLEGGFIYRDTKDYIRRVTNRYTGGLYYGSHENHGRVKTIGGSFDLRYNYRRWLSVGGNLSSQNIRDNERYVDSRTQQESTTYKIRVPNMPYFFINSDVTVHWYNVGQKGSKLTMTYSNNYVKEFPLYWENHGSTSTKLRVPKQFSHDLVCTYSIGKGRYNLSLECRNFTDERLYDNFSLQKAGRSFFGKFRYFFGK